MYPRSLTNWQSRGAYHSVEGLSIFTIDEGDPGLPVLVFLHGYPSCSFDFYRVLPQITQYLRERRKFWHRWVGNLYQTDLPVNILWAEEDPVAVVEMAHELHRHIPNNEMKLLPGLGHYPMLEAPEGWAEALLEMLAFRAA